MELQIAVATLNIIQEYEHIELRLYFEWCSDQFKEYILASFVYKSFRDIDINGTRRGSSSKRAYSD